jgi:hypothetical protein
MPDRAVVDGQERHRLRGRDLVHEGGLAVVVRQRHRDRRGRRIEVRDPPDVLGQPGRDDLG